MSEDAFDYSGHLVFSPFLVHTKGDIITTDGWQYTSEILESLPEYNSGTPSNPSSGYNEVNLPSRSSRNIGIPWWMVDEFDEWTYIRYIWEDYHETEAFVDGAKRTVQIPSKESVDVFFHSTGLAFARGRKSAVHRVTNEIQRYAEGGILLKRIKILPDRITGNLNSNQKEFGELQIETISKANFNAIDSYTDSVSITGDINASHLTEQAYSEGEIVSTTARFRFDEFTLSSSISTNTIHVRADGDLKHLPPLPRIIISVLFSARIVQPLTEFELEQ